MPDKNILTEKNEISQKDIHINQKTDQKDNDDTPRFQTADNVSKTVRDHHLTTPQPKRNDHPPSFQIVDNDSKTIRALQQTTSPAQHKRNYSEGSGFVDRLDSRSSIRSSLHPDSKYRFVNFQILFL